MVDLQEQRDHHNQALEEFEQGLDSAETLLDQIKDAPANTMTPHVLTAIARQLDAFGRWQLHLARRAAGEDYQPVPQGEQGKSADV